MPALIAWTSSPSPGATDDDARVGDAPLIADLGLAGADRLDDDAVEAAGVERVDGSARRPRQAAELAARRDERMKTFGCAAFAPMRMRSPRTAPPLTGLDGSIAITAIV